MVRADGILATLAVGGQAKYRTGCGRTDFVGDDLLVYIQEAALSHALGAVREWLLGTKQLQHLLSDITVRAGSALVHFQVSKWMRGEGFSMSSPAASGILQEVTDLPKWLTIDLAYLPFYIPEDLEGGGMSGEVRSHLCQAEYFLDPQGRWLGKLSGYRQRNCPDTRRGVPANRD